MTIDERLFAPDGEVATAPEDRAEALVTAIEDPETGLILDVTGGDATSSLLRELPTEIAVGGAATWYVGISDNSTVHGWLERAAPGVTRVYWYPTNLVLDDAAIARRRFESLLDGADQHLDLRWIKGERLEGPVAGGNVRCLLKLAGTPFFPELARTTLMLECGSGGRSRFHAYFDQLADAGVLRSLRGLLLGDFGGLSPDDVDELAVYAGRLCGPDIAIAATEFVGHGTDTVPVVLGESLPLAKPG